MGTSVWGEIFYGFDVDDDELIEKLARMSDEKTYIQGLCQIQVWGNMLDYRELVSLIIKDSLISGTSDYASNKTLARHGFNLEAQPEWDKALKEFAEKLGVPWHEPGWMLKGVAI